MPSWVISSVSMASSLFEASNSASSHFVGQPRTNSHFAISSRAVLNCVMTPLRRVSLLPLIHSSRHLSRSDPAVKPFFSTIGDHLVAPTSMNVVSFTPPSRTGIDSVSNFSPLTLLKNAATPEMSILKAKTGSGSLRFPGLASAIVVPFLGGDGGAHCLHERDDDELGGDHGGHAHFADEHPAIDLFEWVRFSIAFYEVRL